ncbi:hypothetical protein [Ralstonia pickettii]|uniref:hypothetical protein n=1 Tax=Ralstonia pickettii TaxID=329 RepID=UPI00046A7391|nr:hypothetical protein [Ralstonia pickettii]
MTPTGNAVVDAGEAARRQAFDLITSNFPDADVNVARAFVHEQFELMNLGGEVISGESIFKRYADSAARKLNADMMEAIEGLLFQRMSLNGSDRAVQIYELQAAFSKAAGEPLSAYASELNAVIDSLVERNFVRVQQPGQRMAMFVRGLKFGTWQAAMQKGQAPVGANRNASAAVAPVQTFNYNVTVNGNNARFNQNSVDNSTNMIATDGALESKLAELRSAIEALSSDTAARSEALEVVSAVEVEVATGKPRKGIVKALLASLPDIGAVATLANSIIGMLQ